jgi:riboflavin synthase
MFTGIVKAVGRVSEAGPNRLAVTAPGLVPSLEVGGSIAVNGCCLTVVQVRDVTFFADVVPETLSRTNLGRLKPGDPVNLEPPLRLDQGLDGHLVQGHIDATTAIASIEEEAAGRKLAVELPAELGAFVAEKGSIAVDGVSLTVARVDDGAGTFTVALIPHTLETTIAATYRKGAQVNLEVDVLARYAERARLRARTRPGY